jgi:hypothetical protein
VTTVNLLSSQFLAWQLGVPLAELRELANDVESHYRIFPLRTGSKVRHLKVPDEKLKNVQRRILRRLLMELPLANALHGGIAGRSPRSNAEQHLGKALVVNLDIRDFFPSVDHRQVAEMFRSEFGCGRDTRWLLTRLTTVDGQLPQGAPTSTMIANLLLSTPVDTPIERKASERHVTFTRFVDDMTFSGLGAEELINDTAKAVSRVGLRTWRKRGKLKITSSSQRQEVTGLTVNSKNGPSISREKRHRIRAAIYNLTRARAGELETQLRSVQGRISYVQQFNPGSAKRLKRQLEHVLRARETDCFASTMKSPSEGGFRDLHST